MWGEAKGCFHLSHREFPRHIATRTRGRARLPPACLPTARPTVLDAHELESRIRIRWHKPMHGGLYGATAPTFAVPFVHRIRRSARRESAKRARNVTCLRVLSILTHYSPLVRSSMSMWAYRIDCRIPFRTLAN